MPLNNKFITFIFIPAQLIALAGILILPWTFDLTILLYLFFGYIVFPGLGSAVGLHRVFSHKAIDLKKGIKIPLLWIASMCLQGNTITWSATHRGRHHRFTDTDKDPHTPKKGFAESYYKWILHWQEHFEPKYAVDLIRDKDHLFFAKWYIEIVLISYILLFLVSPTFALYGVLIPAVYSYHQESIVNWFCHQTKYGYRNFNINNDSTNIKWLGLVTWGQALHNNHHATPTAYSFATKEEEFDPTVIFLPLIKHDS
jgi:stearoyl-CoA desaturase (delta-9 desaturase)